jgi:TPR repeat protein
MYEKGLNFKKDDVIAASYYIRAVRFDSPPQVNFYMIYAKTMNFIMQVQNLSEKKDPEAMFVWYGITILGFNVRIAESDAINLLFESAAKGYLPAINELGLNYYTGNIVAEDKNKAVELWRPLKK